MRNIFCTVLTPAIFVTYTVFEEALIYQGNAQIYLSCFPVYPKTCSVSFAYLIYDLKLGRGTNNEREREICPYWSSHSKNHLIKILHTISIYNRVKFRESPESKIFLIHKYFNVSFKSIKETWIFGQNMFSFTFILNLWHVCLAKQEILTLPEQPAPLPCVKFILFCCCLMTLTQNKMIVTDRVL